MPLNIIFIKLVVLSNSVQNLLVLHLLDLLLLFLLFFILDVEIFLVLELFLLSFPLLKDGFAYSLPLNNFFEVVLDLLSAGLSPDPHQLLLFLQLEFVLLFTLVLDLLLPFVHLLDKTLVLVECAFDLLLVDGLGYFLDG